MFDASTAETFSLGDVLRVPCSILQESAGTIMQAVQGDAAGSRQRSPDRPDILSAALKAAVPALGWVNTLLLPQRERAVAYDEFMNKWQVIEWVADTGSLLDLSSASGVPLAELVERAYGLEPFPALWAVEGLGNYYAESAWQQNGVPRGLLSSEETGRLPGKSLTMLHAGMGLAFARRCLRTVSTRSGSSEIDDMLERFVALCRENSRAGYAGCALESLGLVTETLYPEMVSAVDRRLSEIVGDVVSYFWHGFGRAVYFSPGNFLPICGSPWRAVEMSWQTPPHDLGRLNALAGVAWAVTLVNMRNPEVLESLLSRHAALLSQSGAFCDGVRSSLIVRYDTTPDDPDIASFCRYQPDPSDPRLARLWTDQVSDSCSEGLRRLYPLLARRHRLDELFHYQAVAGAA
jgi:hypothetical protein